MKNFSKTLVFLLFVTNASRVCVNRCSKHAIRNCRSLKNLFCHVFFYKNLFLFSTRKISNSKRFAKSMQHCIYVNKCVFVITVKKINRNACTFGTYTFGEGIFKLIYFCYNCTTCNTENVDESIK